MASKFRVRHIFRPLVKAIARGLSKIGVTPNMATCIMLFFSFLSLLCLLILNNLLLFGIFIFLCGIFDGVDGAIARITDTSSQKGGFFDSVMDRFSEFIIYLALLLYCWDEILWNIFDMKLVILFTLFASILISYSRARAENFYKGDFDIGLMARSERLFFLFVTMVIAYFIGFMNEFLFIFMWLVIGTYLFRFLKIRKLIMENESKEH